jgi:hypothetical protein
LTKPPKTFIALLLVLVLSGGCIYLPKTIEVYNAECGTYQRHMTLEVHQAGAIAGCANESCVALLVLFGAVSATTAVVSGSVVAVGNVVYWLEKQGQCPGTRQKPE